MYNQGFSIVSLHKDSENNRLMAVLFIKGDTRCSRSVLGIGATPTLAAWSAWLHALIQKGEALEQVEFGEN